MDVVLSIDPLYALSGFGVGVLVGMTGVGGGSLMTPLLILLFGIHPATAVGTDLLFAAATKTGGTLVHGLSRTVEWAVVGRLALGSIPAAAVTLFALSQLDLANTDSRHAISFALAGTLLLSAAALVCRDAIMARHAEGIARLSGQRTATFTVAAGAVLGSLVAATSIGAGAIGATMLLLSISPPRLHQDRRLRYRPRGSPDSRCRLGPLAAGLHKLDDPGHASRRLPAERAFGRLCCRPGA
jgi:uncharacterized protein